MENGDDIVVDGPGIDRAEGQLGFDWISFQNDTLGVNVDLDLTIFLRPTLPPSNNTVQNRYDRVEAISGSPHSDILRGTPNRPGTSAGNELVVTASRDGFDLIEGLSDLVPEDERGPLPNDPVTGEAQTGWDGGEIIIGGGGSDLLVGEAGDDILDGDYSLTVALEAGMMVFDGMAQLFEPVFFGGVDSGISPCDISISRMLLDADMGQVDTDTALFSGNASDYTVLEENGFLRVTDTRPLGLNLPRVRLAMTGSIS